MEELVAGRHSLGLDWCHDFSWAWCVVRNRKFVKLCILRDVQLSRAVKVKFSSRRKRCRSVGNGNAENAVKGRL